MRFPKSISDRLSDQVKSKNKLLAKVAEVKARASQVTDATDSNARQDFSSEIKNGDSPNFRPWAEVKAGSSGFRYFERATGEEVFLQPWTYSIVDSFLRLASHSGIKLCLIWPTKIESLSLVHALANIERFSAKDLMGLKTILFPGTYSSRASLNEYSANRSQLGDIYRSLWISQEDGNHEMQPATSSSSFSAILAANNTIHGSHPEIPSPSFAEIIPAFIFDKNQDRWVSTSGAPMERTLLKVDRLVYRRQLRERANEWLNPEAAPGALMVLHNTSRKAAWHKALTASVFDGNRRPEVFLLDASEASKRRKYSAVRKIPEFISWARENGFQNSGFIIITDDPKTFFINRARLHQEKLRFSTSVWAAEANETFLSANPVAKGWTPQPRGSSSFRINIVDRTASQLALKFQRLSALAGNGDDPGSQALLEACMYVLRLSNMPAGYKDLTAFSEEVGGGDYVSRQNAWAPVKIRIMEALSAGSLNSQRDAVEEAIEKTDKLLDDWNDATPMAARVLAEVQRSLSSNRRKISLVLPNSRYVQLAHRFLERKLGFEWVSVEAQVEWHTLSSVGKTLAGDYKGKDLTFIGFNSDVLRLLLAHPDVPYSTSVLVAYRQAESLLDTLTHMKDIDAFKPYRGRIDSLAKELDARLSEVPDPLTIRELREISLTFKFDDHVNNGRNGTSEYYKLKLEGDGHVYASGWIYRYVPDNDPPFRRTSVSSIQSGDFIFEMSDDLRAKLESLLHMTESGISSDINPVRVLLKLYHDEVKRRCDLMFKSSKRSVLARKIQAKMVELDPNARECRPGRVYYWLGLQEKDDTRPHAANDANYFRIFCKALGISDEMTEKHWEFVRNARRLNQYLGRDLVSRYAEILFQPESALIYQKLSKETIRKLQQDALRCVYRVEHVVAPNGILLQKKEGDGNANSK